MPGADDLMMRIYAAMVQKERELMRGLGNPMDCVVVKPVDGGC